MHETDPAAKTIVFCVDQEHAAEMAMALGNLNAKMMQVYPDYVARVTADEGDIGRGHLSNFQDVDRTSPVILTTSQLLTTGVDAPTCKNVVLARVVGSMVEFKQIIGRGTRVREDYGKLSFNIIDYTGSATEHFADPAFDGDPVTVDVTEIDATGQTIGQVTLIETTEGEQEDEERPAAGEDERPGYDAGAQDDKLPRKLYFDEGRVEIVAHVVHELTPDGRLLRTVKLTDYTGDVVRTLVPSAGDLRAVWVDPTQRQLILDKLAERGLTPDLIAERTGHADADTFDLLCHLAFSAPLLTRRERASRVMKERAEFFARYGPEARQILSELLDKYADFGVTQLRLPDVLKLPPISEHGNPLEIAAAFGGAERLREAVTDLQTLLYAGPDAA
jgi:type I restriction enzyme R subunit